MASEKSSSSSHLFVFTAAKAGMNKVDREKVNQVIHDMSKGSKYMANAEENDKKTEAQISRMRETLRSCRSSEIIARRRVLDDQRVPRLLRKADRVRSRVSLLGGRVPPLMVVIDMDMFFAAVELRDAPELREKPVAVGGMGMICTSNYVARQYGVRAAMPGFIAVKLCPDLVFVKPNFEKYTAVAGLTRDVYREYDKNFSACSLDEAILNLAPAVQKRLEEEGNLEPTRQEVKTTAGSILHEIRMKVTNATGGLTCSAGLGPTTLVAKIASDYNKPNGQHVVLPEDDQDLRASTLTFLHALGVRKICGVGKVTQRLLEKALDVHTVSDLYEKRAEVSLAFGIEKAVSKFLLRVSLGLGSEEEEDNWLRTSHNDGVESNDAVQGQVVNRKGIGCERTFQAQHTKAELQETLHRICTSLAESMAKESLCGRNVTLKLKTSDFHVRTRATMVPKGVSSEKDLIAAAQPLLEKEYRDVTEVGVRLMGVRVSQFLRAFVVPEADQRTLHQMYFAREGRRNMCPVCGEWFHMSLQDFNKHLDECLEDPQVLEVKKCTKSASVAGSLVQSKNKAEQRETDSANDDRSAAYPLQQRSEPSLENVDRIDPAPASALEKLWSKRALERGSRTTTQRGPPSPRQPHEPEQSHSAEQTDRSAEQMKESGDDSFVEVKNGLSSNRRNEGSGKPHDMDNRATVKRKQHSSTRLGSKKRRKEQLTMREYFV